MLDIPPLWVLIHKESDRPSFLSFQDDPTVVGPFLYLSEEKAKKALEVKSYLKGPVEVKQISGSDFVQQVIERFMNSDTDAFGINDVFFPLTLQGAKWVDEGTESSAQWEKSIQESKIAALQQLLEMLGQILGASQLAISNPDEAQAKVEEHVKLRVEAEAQVLGTWALPTITFHVHTVGMEAFGRLDLELRGVPALYLPHAAQLLMGWAAASLVVPLEDGDVISEGGAIPLQVLATKSPIGDCLTMTVSDVRYDFGERVLH